MKVKLDENLPHALVQSLAALGHDVDSVLHEGMQGKPDADVFTAAQQDERLLITQDLDFSDLRKFAPGTHHGIVVVRLAKPGRIALRQRIEAMFRTEMVHEWKGCFVVVSEHKLRIRRAKP